MQQPELSVIVASHGRPLRLRWLLNALHEQTLDRGLWELVVCHDSGEDTERLLQTHPLCELGTLRHARLPPGSAGLGAARNQALGLARAPAIVFTEDDCRPPRDWLEQVRYAVARRPGAIVQGPVSPDPDEAAILQSPFPRTRRFRDVPRPWGECCNIVYPRLVLERLGGFDEALGAGADADLCQRALAGGAQYAGEEAMASFHAVEERGLVGRLRDSRHLGELAVLLGRHPGLRDHLFARIFWSDAHAYAVLGVCGLGAVRRRPVAMLLAAPWLYRRRPRRGRPHRRRRQLLALPAWALIDLVESAVLARAAIRHRTVVL